MLKLCPLCRYAIETGFASAALLSALVAAFHAVFG